MVNIFIISAAQHALAAREILATMNRCEIAKSWVFDLRRGKFSEPEKFLMVKYTRLYVDSAAERSSSLRRFAAECDSRFGCSDSLNLFYGHLYNQASNYAYFNCKPCEYIIIPDGVFNYRKKSVFLSFIVSQIVKFVFGLFCGVRYKIVKNPFYTSNKIDGPKKAFVFGTLPANIDGAIYCFLSSGAVTVDPVLGRVLIVGVPVPGRFKEVLNYRLRKYLYSIKLEQVYLKPHPSEVGVCSLFLSEDMDVSVVKDRGPVEDIIEIIRPEVVVSFCSSALPLIKWRYPALRCVAIGIDELIPDPGVVDYFSESGVEVFHG